MVAVTKQSSPQGQSKMMRHDLRSRQNQSQNQGWWQRPGSIKSAVIARQSQGQNQPRSAAKLNQECSDCQAGESRQGRTKGMAGKQLSRARSGRPQPGRGKPTTEPGQALGTHRSHPGEKGAFSYHWLWHSFAQLCHQLHDSRGSLEHGQLSPWQVIHCIQSLVVDPGTIQGNFVIGLIRVRNSSPALCLTIGFLLL